MIILMLNCIVDLLLDLIYLHDLCYVLYSRTVEYPQLIYGCHGIRVHQGQGYKGRGKKYC